MCVRILLFLYETHVKIFDHIDGEDLHIGLSKCLSKTDTLAAQPRTESHCFSLTAIWRQRKRVVAIKPLGMKLVRLIPVIGMPVQSSNVDLHNITSFDAVLANHRVGLKI